MRLRWENFGGWLGEHMYAALISYLVAWVGIISYEIFVMVEVWIFLPSLFGGLGLFYLWQQFLIGLVDKHNPPGGRRNRV